MIDMTFHISYDGNEPMNNLARQIEPQRELVLDEFVPCRLSNLSYAVGRSISSILGSRFGITTSEWRVLVVLGRWQGLSAVEVAERTLLDKVAVSRAVGKLLKNGLVDRRFADADRRRSVLNLSEEGRQLLLEIAPTALDFEDSLLRSLSDAEVNVFSRVIEKLLADVSRSSPSCQAVAES
jgi:DNA-binding MarR family transcriptional regulator